MQKYFEWLLDAIENGASPKKVMQIVEIIFEIGIEQTIGESTEVIAKNYVSAEILVIIEKIANKKIKVGDGESIKNEIRKRIKRLTKNLQQNQAVIKYVEFPKNITLKKIRENQVFIFPLRKKIVGGGKKS